MPGFSIDGLASGLDTTALITQLMAVESIPQRQLQNRVTDTNKVVTALQGLNTRAASLATAATALAGPTGFQAVTATSSNAAATATAQPGATPSSIRFDVQAIAAAHSLAGPEQPSPPPAPSTPGPTINITRGGVTSAPIRVSSKDPVVIAQAINDAKVGVNAIAVQVRPGVYRVQVSAAESGAKGAFTVSGLGTTSVVRTGADAKISLGGNLVVTSASNTFTGVAPGVSVTVNAVVKNIAVDVTADNASNTTAVKGLVNNLNTLLSDISSQSKAPGTGTAAGVLLGNSTVRGLTQSLTSAVSGSAAAGIQLTRDGTVTFDEAAFTKLLADDPARARGVVAALAGRVQSAAENASRAGTGSLAQLITNRQDQVKDFTTQIASWDDRLALRESSLKRTYASLEVALKGMQSQSQWLAGQLAGLSR